ncbi:MAG: SpvB/TcaC N-terminal domain-containing protein [Cyanobacteria bacterium P01_D01_bin.156]
MEQLGVPNSVNRQGDAQAKLTGAGYISSPAAVSLPKGGGAIRGIGEKFSVNPVTGTGALNVPIFASPSRHDFHPQLSLSYDSGAGNGVFGLGWSLSVPSITRKTSKGLPKYLDNEDSDVFILSGAEDLVSVPPVEDDPKSETYEICQYRPRVEGLFARIERWCNLETGEVHWRSHSKDNVTSIYGLSSVLNSRIADATNNLRVFEWLLEASYDDKGNLIVYEYKRDDSENIDRTFLSESNRLAHQTSHANVYLKRIRYGNLMPYRQGANEPSWDNPYSSSEPGDRQWLFQLVFDYGEHVGDSPTAEEDQPWSSRPDPFSTYRSGFEIRTQRLCQRTLMFHRMDETGDRDTVGTWHLVRSTDFGYEPNPVATYLTSVTQTGYAAKDTEGNQLSRSYPPLELQYGRPDVKTDIQTVDPDSLQNLPMGLDGSTYQWVDLDSEGIAGILTEQAKGWFYKRNLGPDPSEVKQKKRERVGTVRFGEVERLTTLPSIANLQSIQQQLLDLAGDGTQDLVSFGTLSGYYQREKTGEWRSFTPFKSSPTVNWNDPNLRFIDLNGDGHADILISEHNVFVWFPSLARDGFGPAQRVQRLQDESRSPTLVFADVRESVFLADMSGDGLVDIVRIRNGEVCYWPNLGYAHFGAKVTMDRSPVFEHPEVFDQKRIRLSDIDGSGTTDIVYLGRQSVSLWFNQSGNGWSEPKHVTSLPIADNLASVNVLDLLGNGTACIVWSSRSPGYGHQPMYYIDLMDGLKPHLLQSVINNLGAETHLHYASSTHFYLQDRAAGKPWITRLSFPVQVVDRVETLDRISGNRFVTIYRYRHGYFDGEEREFRGFGYVEQVDTETYEVFEAGGGTNAEKGLYVPPAVTKTWFHTGFYRDREHISKLFTEEYYQGDRNASLLLDTVLPEGLTIEEEREACRALKGQLLRQEVYALDKTVESVHPYTVTESNYTLKLLQSRKGGQYAVFFVHPRESLNYQYERNPDDPRVAHELTLEVDDFGNVTQSVAIAYPRRQAAFPIQSQILATLTEAVFYNQWKENDVYQIGVPIETRQYEVTGLPSQAKVLDFDEVETAIATTDSKTARISYEEKPSSGLERRLIEQDRTLYYKADLSGALELGDVHSPALPFESYRLAFTPGLLGKVFQDKMDPASVARILTNEGQYRDLDDDGNLWIPSGQQVFDPDKFYLPVAFRDPFMGSNGEPYRTTYDDEKSLLVVETVDPLRNQIQIQNNYRTLQPQQMIDPNGNRSEVAFDTLGMVVGTAVMGKEDENLGDSLEGFEPDLEESRIRDYLESENPIENNPEEILKSATTRLVYDLHAYRRSQQENELPQPVVVYTLARETHVSDVADLPEGEILQIQHSFLYSDGFGREVQTKIQAEPGPLDLDDPDSPIVNPRWVGTGRTVYNNKGNPVKQYEPFFSRTHRYDAEAKMVEQGVTPILFYDPLQRTVATLLPNHTYEKVVFDAWQQATWDVNDTVLQEDPSKDEDVGGYIKGLDQKVYTPSWHKQRTDPAEALLKWPDVDISGNPIPGNATIRASEKEAANKTVAHAGTPTITHLDTLGRTFLTVADNKAEQYTTQVELDIEGNQRSVTDARGRVVMTYDYDMLGNVIRQQSMEAGERFMLNNVAGNVIRRWDSRKHQLRTLYDRLQRPTHVFMQPEDGAEQLVERLIYGEDLAKLNEAQRERTKSLNLLGQLHQHYEQAGLVTNVQFDFKGNLLESSRRLATEYKQVVDWSALAQLGDVRRIATTAERSLEAEVFTSRTRYDALNRPVMMVTPSNARTLPNVIQPRYNEANLLEQVNVWLRQAAVPGGLLVPETAADFVAVQNIDYNEKGHRTKIEYGIEDGIEAATTYEYDRETFRLIRLLTIRENLETQVKETLQDYRYTYDPVGNITRIRDDAQQTIFFNGEVVSPECDYTYDAIYRLIKAEGREHIGQVGQSETTWNDEFRVNRPHPNDGQAMRNYTESYVYDAVGNFERLTHQAESGTWNRAYAYQESSLIDGDRQSNRLSSTAVTNAGGSRTEAYSYDAHGNMMRMPHLPEMVWDYRDQLQATSRQVRNEGTPEKTYYVYDASGERLRKVTERQAAVGQAASRRKERIYLGGFEIYREFDGSGRNVNLERETLHVMDDQQRIALVEMRTQGNDGSPEQIVRFQLANHLGSACLELNRRAEIVSYEEYYPFGSTAYQGVQRGIEISRKRYRYTGKERDDESGLYYHGVRYYASWLARWISHDPAEFEDEINLYIYAKNNPVRFWDPDGEAVETAFDVISLGIGIASLRQNIREGNVGDSIIDAIGIVADAAAAATPFVPGGAGAGIKAIRAGDKAVDSIKTVKKGEKVSASTRKTNKTSKALKKDNKLAQTNDIPQNTERLLPGVSGKVTGGDSQKLKGNLNEAMGLNRSQNTSGYQAHHLIPSNLKKHPVLNKVGIDLDDASNGIFLFSSKGKPEDLVSARPRHTGAHPGFNQAVKESLDKLDINLPVQELQKDVVNLQNRLRDLINSGLPVRNKDARKAIGNTMLQRNKNQLTQETKELWMRRLKE